MTRPRRPAGHPIGPVGWRGDERAVSDVVGSILLVGITVVAAVGLGLLILAFDGPPDTQHSRLVVSMSPGAGGWNTGDEQLRLAHLGGEPLDADDVRIIYTPPGGTPVTLSGVALGSAFSDGELVIGETWSLSLTAALNDLYDVKVVVDGARSQLLADATVVAGSTGGGVLCLGDTTAPTAAFSAADVNSLSSGPVNVTVTLADNCSGVNETAAPHLWWCVAVTCAVPGDYTDAGAMADTGLRMWSANVPSHNWLTEALAGTSLRYYVTGMTDLNGNVAQSSVQVDLVDLVLTYVYVTSATPTTGTVTNLVNAQGPADGTEADLAEGAVPVTPTSVGPTKYSGTTAVGTGVADATPVLATGGSRAILDATDDAIELTGFDLPSNAATITSISIGYEGQRSGGGGNDPTARLDYKIGSGSYVLGTPFTEDSNSDTDRFQALSGTFSVADVEAMTLRVYAVNVDAKDLEIDHLFVYVTYETAANQYAMDVRLDWTGVSSGTTQQVQLQYRVTGDTFNVQVWNFLLSTWRTCTGTLTSASSASYSCSLVLPAEFNAGEVRVRFTDATPTGSTQGHLFLDHARVGTL